jgi:hypothetical protein
MQPEGANRGKAGCDQRDRKSQQQGENRERKNKCRRVENPITEQARVHGRHRALAPNRRNTVGHRTF